MLMKRSASAHVAHDEYAGNTGLQFRGVKTRNHPDRANLRRFEVNVFAIYRYWQDDFRIAMVCEVTPTTVFGFGKGESFSLDINSGNMFTIGVNRLDNRINEGNLKDGCHDERNQKKPTSLTQQSEFARRA